MRPLTTVQELVTSGQVDRVVVQDRQGRVFFDAEIDAGGAALGQAAARAVDEARDARILTPEQAQSWLAITSDALRARRQFGHDDDDLVRVCARLATIDAAAIVAQAYPDNQDAQREALANLSE